jgi:septum formation protein
MTLPQHSPIILASASPRRQNLLRNAGIEFEIWPADIPEVPRAHETPVGFAKRMAQEKTQAVLARFPDRVILAADTVVAVGGEVLGKPVDADDAIRMLRLLSGRTHEVTTGVCVANEGAEEVQSETTAVEFREISENEIRAYVATGEPMDKAGAYAIQGGAAKWVIKAEGDYNNVVGLPVDLVLRVLGGLGRSDSPR